jgi:hypothetical protein
MLLFLKAFLQSILVVPDLFRDLGMPDQVRQNKLFMPSKKRQHTELRRLLFLILLIAFMAGGVALLRAHFLNLPAPEISPIPQVAGRTDSRVSPIPNISREPLAQAEVWGSDIADSSKLPTTNGVWLKLITQGAIYIGEIRSDATFSTLYRLSLFARNIHLFSNKSLLYTLTDNNLDSVVGISKTGNTKLYTAGINQSISSIYFEPSSKSEYIAVSYGSAIQFILLKPRTEPLSIFSSNEYASPQISRVDLTKNILSFRDGVSNKCFDLNLLTKQVNSASCSTAIAFKLPSTAPALDETYELQAAKQFKDGKIVAIVTDLASGQKLLINTAEEWQIINIPECGTSCTYQFL